MDKDTMAKVNEMLKEKGFQELSLDDLEHVSGGDTISIDSDVKAFNEQWQYICATVGWDAASDFFIKMNGLVEPSDLYRIPSGSDRDKMDCLLNMYWQRRERGDGYSIRPF